MISSYVLSHRTDAQAIAKVDALLMQYILRVALKQGVSAAKVIERLRPLRRGFYIIRSGQFVLGENLVHQRVRSLPWVVMTREHADALILISCPGQPLQVNGSRSLTSTSLPGRHSTSGIRI